MGRPLMVRSDSRDLDDVAIYPYVSDQQQGGYWTQVELTVLSLIATRVTGSRSSVSS
jgi:hypothetical protein